jgi:hypothetical protein
MKTGRRSAWAGLIALAGLAACGGGNTVPASCGKVPPCGGSVVGQWTIEGGCNAEVTLSGTLAQLKASCPALTTSSVLSVAGTIDFNADQTYDGQSTIGGSVSLQIPPDCLTNMGLTCAGLNQRLGSPAHCSSDGAACDCTVDLPSQPAMAAGTYSVSGMSLTLSATAGSSETDEFCLQGDELHLVRVAAMSGGSMGAVVTSDTVLKRR